MKPNIEHFTHQGHSLTVANGSEEFHCDGCKCKTPGNGPRYRCHTCDFNMHEYCGVCPSTLSTFMHPQHQLKQVIRTQGRRNNKRLCNLCRDDVEGLFYRCTVCDFNIHPLCTKVPEYLPHPLHPTHPLKLQTSPSGSCSVCNSECTSWRYGCCSFDIHLECILASWNASTASRSVAAPAPPHGVAPSLLPWGWGWGCSYGGPTPHGAYGPSPYHAYGLQHPYCSSTPPPYYPSGPSPTHFGSYVHPYAYAPPLPPSSYGAAPPPFHGGAPPPPPPTHVAAPPPHSYGAYAQGTGKPSNGMLSKVIYMLSMGVLTNLIAGGITDSL